MKSIIFVSLLALLMMNLANAEEPEMIERSWDFGIGIGFGQQSNPFIGADDVPGYITLDLSIYGKRFFFDNGEVGFTLIDRPLFGANLIADYSSERIYYSYFNELGLLRSGLGVGGASGSLSVVPSDQFSGATSPSPPGVFSQLNLPDRDFAVNLGLELLIDTTVGQFQWQVAQDVSGTHKGTRMEFDFSRSWEKERWAFKSSVGLSWKSEELVGYYYGINNQTELFTLRYDGKATTNINWGFLLSYRINNHLSYVNHFKYTYLGSGIRKSPLIDSNSSQSYFSGLYYRF